MSWDRCVQPCWGRELQLPALQSSDISDCYPNSSPYFCFTQKCQFQLWLKHPGKGVALCPCVLCQQKDQGMISVSAPSSASLNSNFVPQNAGSPPSFIAAELLLGVKWTGRFCYCYSALSLRAWFWPVSPHWDQPLVPKLFQLLLTSLWLLQVRGSPAQGSHPKNTTWYHYWANSATSSHAKYL